MKIAFTFLYYKAVTPESWVAELTEEQWHEFRSLTPDERKDYIQWLFHLGTSVREMWWIPLNINSKLILKENVKVLKRQPTEAEIIYRDLLKKHKGTKYGREILLELEQAVDDENKLYEFVMYAHEHKRCFHICYYNVDEEPDKNKIIYVGELVDNTGYMYLLK